MGVFRSLNYDNDLREAAMLSQAVYKLPSILREQWSMHTVVKDMLRTMLIDFNDWLKRKAEAHERMNVSGVSEPKIVSLFPPQQQLPGPHCTLQPGMRKGLTRKVIFRPAHVAEANTHFGRVMNSKRNDPRSARNLTLIIISAFDA